MPLQCAGQSTYHPGDQRPQIVRPVACGKHDDDRKRMVVQVLPMRESAVYGDRRIESAIRIESEKGTASGTGPSHPRDGSNLVGGRKGRP